MCGAVIPRGLQSNMLKLLRYFISTIDTIELRRKVTKGRCVLTDPGHRVLVYCLDENSTTKRLNTFKDTFGANTTYNINFRKDVMMPLHFNSLTVLYNRT